ncbi:MAG: DUF4382 domain-containing protein [Reichenbachiella sp.]
MISKTGYLFSFIFIWAFIIGCQESAYEIKVSTNGSNITSGSSLANLISFSTLNDGSEDNILDNASLTSIKFPVTVIANDQQLLVESIDDLANIENIYHVERYLKDSIQLLFPVKAILPNYTEVTIESQTALDDLVSQSIEGGEDDDIECRKFVFPLTVNYYDAQNQRAFIKEFQIDRELNLFIDGLHESDVFSFSYPIGLETKDGNEQNIVQNNDDLTDLLNNGIDLCEENDEKYYNDGDYNFNTGKLNIELTDAPFPTDLVEQANVSIDLLEIKKSNASEGGEEDYLILSENELSFNLIDLTNGITTALVGMQIPVGEYDQMRMRINEATVVLKDGSIFDLDIPSGSVNGVKIIFKSPLSISENAEENLLLDFDVSRSFVVQGNASSPSGINGFLFNPVIKAINLSETGSLSGTVSDELSKNPLPNSQISIYAADTLNTTTFTNIDGDYMALGLSPGVYKVAAENNSYLSMTEENILINQGEETELNFELTSHK